MMILSGQKLAFHYTIRYIFLVISYPVFRMLNLILMVVQAKSPWKVYLLQRPIIHSKSNTAALEIICSCRLQYRFPLMVGSLKRILYINKNDNVEIGAPHNELFCLSQLCVFQLCSFEYHCSCLSGQFRQVVVASIAEEGDTGPRGGQSLISCSGRCWSGVTRLSGLHSS